MDLFKPKKQSVPARTVVPEPEKVEKPVEMPTIEQAAEIDDREQKRKRRGFQRSFAKDVALGGDADTIMSGGSTYRGGTK